MVSRVKVSAGALRQLSVRRVRAAIDARPGAAVPLRMLSVGMLPARVMWILSSEPLCIPFYSDETSPGVAQPVDVANISRAPAHGGRGRLRTGCGRDQPACALM